jgi:hypothetical protein
MNFVMNESDCQKQSQYLISCMYLGETGLFEMLGIGIGELRIPLDVGLVRPSM